MRSRWRSNALEASLRTRCWAICGASFQPVASQRPQAVGDAGTLDYWTSTTFGDIKSHANVIVFGKSLSKAGD
jgi:hypothetical protein